MRICEYINVSDERLMDGLGPVVRIMQQLESAGPEEQVTVDLSRTRFISPVFALSLIVYLTRCGRPVTIEGAHDYMEVIGLDNGGIQPDQMRKSEFLATMEGYSRKTYIPIVSFPAQAGKVPS